MKVLKFVLYTIVGLAALWLLLCLFAKKTYRIERSQEIETPLAVPYGQVRLFKNLPNWSPWQQLDPNMTTSIKGTDGEVGAVYHWAGNDDAGTGTQTIKSITTTRIELDVDYGFGPSPVVFNFEEKGKKTNVTWTMDIHPPFLLRAGGLFTDFNSYIGKDFEVGLQNLKKYCEALVAPKKYRGYEVTEIDFPTTYYAGVRQVVAFSDIQKFYAENFVKAMQEAGKAGAKMEGHPSGFFWTYDTVAMKTDMAAAMPMDRQVKLGNGVQTITATGRKALVVNYLGDYNKMEDAHDAIAEYMAANHLQDVPPAIEEYVTDPAQEPDTAKWLTRVIYFAVPKPDSTEVKK
jgi:effector-binding domain-containing protein